MRTMTNQTTPTSSQIQWELENGWRLPTEEPMTNYGKIAYEAYCKHTGGTSLVSGATLPAWDELKFEIQEAWNAAAEAAVAHYAAGRPRA